jgi:hypothetical protein
MPTIDLTDEQLETVIRILRRSIDEDRYPLSERVRTWRDALAALDPSSKPKPIAERPPLRSIPKAARPRAIRRRRR